MKVVRLSALCTGRLYPPGNITDTHLCLSQPQGHSATEGLCQWKIPMAPSGFVPATFRLVSFTYYSTNIPKNFNLWFSSTFCWFRVLSLALCSHSPSKLCLRPNDKLHIHIRWHVNHIFIFTYLAQGSRHDSDMKVSCHLQQSICNYFTFCLPWISVRFLLITNLTHFFQCIYLFHFSTCFDRPNAHHQENQLYQDIIWYVSLCVGDCLVCWTGIPDTSTQSDIYQMMYWYNCFSWWWALGRSKHVEKWNKWINTLKKVRQVGVINKNL